MIAPELIEQIKDAADMVQLIGEHVELKRTGADWRGPCPFHGGTHRNFSVVPKKQMYHCFVCHESGDVITFWMKRFGLDYPAAVREIAGRVGIEVPEARQAGPDPNEPLYSALGVAAEWFARRLAESDDARGAREYLASRAIGEEVRDRFQLGYAPRGDALLEALGALGIAPDVLAQAGLTHARDDGTVVPRFRGRLIFPIADVRGRVVGFGGRILGEGEPKYLNSPESGVYHKGALLYGLHTARTAIRTEGLAVLVEGYVDCIRLQAAGLGHTVAPLGTSLTAEQARVMRRYAAQVAIAYDADQPGLRSTFRAADELLRQGAAVSVVTLPPGEDPDTLVLRGGAAAFRALLGGAVDVLERKIQLLEQKGLFATLQGRRRALDRLLPTMRAAADPLTRGLYIARASEKSGVPVEVLEAEAAKADWRTGGLAARDGAHAARPGAGAHSPPDRPSARPPDIPPERDLIRLMLRDPAFVPRAGAELDAAQLRHPVYAEVFALLVGGTAEPPEHLAGEWERLARPAEGGFDAEAEFANAVAQIRDRPRLARLEEIESLMPVARPEEKEQLLREQMALLAAGPRRQRRKGLGPARRS